MLPRDEIASGVWQLLEAFYLESLSERAQREYARLDESEKWTTLIEFAKDQATRSTRWAEITRELEIIDPDRYGTHAANQRLRMCRHEGDSGRPLV
jgi:hypothetical protein